MTGMRLQRGVSVGGVEPELARAIARCCHDRWSTPAQIAYGVRVDESAVAPMLEGLAMAGFLDSRAGTRPSDGGREWNTTLSGGALTMASFLKPISRTRADTLLAGVLQRVAAYNEDDTKPYVITEIAVFGSYVRPEVEKLGDLDLAVSSAPRQPGSDSTEVKLAFAGASGRRFRTFIDRLFWAREDLLRTLRARSGYIKVHTEDISRFTDESRIVYSSAE